MPPIAQLTCGQASGPTIQPEDDSWSLSTSSLMPGSTTAMPASVSTEPIRVQYFVQSITTAALQHCPARLVPPPRDNTGQVVAAAHVNGLGPGIRRARHDHADGHLPVVGGVGGVGRARAGIESDLPVDAFRRANHRRPLRTTSAFGPRVAVMGSALLVRQEFLRFGFEADLDEAHAVFVTRQHRGSGRLELVPGGMRRNRWMSGSVSTSSTVGRSAESASRHASASSSGSLMDIALRPRPAAKRREIDVGKALGFSEFRCAGHGPRSQVT